MDFAQELIQSQGHGCYESLSCNDLPAFFLAYLSDPSDSGKIHSTVRQRFDKGETEVVEAMRTFADLTTKAKAAIEGGDWLLFSDLMRQNFELRRVIYGEPCLGAENLRMVELGSEFGAACKFPGNLGIIVN